MIRFFSPFISIHLIFVLTVTLNYLNATLTVSLWLIHLNYHIQHKSFGVPSEVLSLFLFVIFLTIFTGRYASERQNSDTCWFLARGIWWAWWEAPSVLLGIFWTEGVFDICYTIENKLYYTYMGNPFTFKLFKETPVALLPFAAVLFLILSCISSLCQF